MRRGSVIVVVVAAVAGLLLAARARLRRAATTAPAVAPVRADAAAPPPCDGPCADAAHRADGSRRAAADAAAPAGLDMLAAAADVAARLHACRASAPSPWSGRAALGRFQLSPSGTLVAGAVVDGRDPASGPPITDDCFARALHDQDAAPDAAAAADAGAQRDLVTLWWPFAFADATARPAGADGGARRPGGAAPVDLLVLPGAYPRNGLPQDLSGPWLGLCAAGPRGRAWTPVTLTSDTDEDNEDFLDVQVEGCGAKPQLVPVVRGAALIAGGGAGRVRAAAGSPAAEAAVRFGRQRYTLWQLRAGRPSGVVALRFERQVQVLLPETDPEWDYQVTWAGDLDGDQRVDLVLRDGEPDMARYSLFLSAAAPAGLPLGLAGQVTMSGD